MNRYQIEALAFEERAMRLMRERSSILALQRPLTAAEIDRLFDTAKEIDALFEHQSMLLPLIEDLATQNRWDSTHAFMGTLAADEL